MVRVAVALGGNIAPEQRIPQAARLLRQQFPDARFSSCYRNAAVGFTGNDFINAAAQFSTDLPLAALLDTLHAVEERCGRKRDDPKWAPRAMDIDLLLYGDLVSELPGATVPRRDLARRAYMLGPMAELAPGWIHPVAHRSLAEMWHELAAGAAPLTRLATDLNAL